MSAMPDSIAVTTGARLHFGFFAHQATNLAAAASNHLLERSNYGGVGMMIESPSVVVAASRSDRDVVICRELTPPEAAAAESTVARIIAQYRRSCPAQRQPPPCAIAVRRVIPSHRGLGSGTQLGMAVAQALAFLAGDGQADAPTLARRVGRGNRSAIGIHGFARGGFLVDGGKRADDEIGQLVARADLPDDWRLLLITPGASSAAGLAGQEEVTALEQVARDAGDAHRTALPAGRAGDAPRRRAVRLRLVWRSPVSIRRDRSENISARCRGGPTPIRS